MLGEYTWYVVAALAITLMFFALLLVAMAQYRNRRAAATKIFGIFVPPDGKAYAVLCDADSYNVTPPKRGDHQGLESGYHINRDTVAKIDWPVNRWKLLQTVIPMALFMEGHSGAIPLYDTAPPIHTDQYVKAVQNARTAGALVGALKEYSGSKVGKMAGNLRWVYVGIVIAIVIAAAAVYFNMQTQDLIETRIPEGL